jgi:hypothetical protein
VSVPGRTAFWARINVLESPSLSNSLRNRLFNSIMPSENVVHIVAIFAEAVLYGIYLVTFAWCLKDITMGKIASGIQLETRRRRRWSYLVLSVTLLMFVSSTVNIILGLIRLVQAFGVEPISPNAVSRLPGSWINLVKI